MPLLSRTLRNTSGPEAGHEPQVGGTGQNLHGHLTTQPVRLADPRDNYLHGRSFARN